MEKERLHDYNEIVPVNKIAHFDPNVTREGIRYENFVVIIPV